MEAGRSKAKKGELIKLLGLYGADDEVREQLEKTRQESERRGWWESYRLPSWFEPFVDFESHAVELINFELHLVPGLLQTEAYAYEVHRAGRYDTDPRDIAKRVRARMERQRRLTETTPLQFRAVISESAFHQQVGGAEVMREQIDHVIQSCQLPNVIVQMLPHEVGAHASPSGPFVVCSFSGQEESIGFLDTVLGGHTVDEEEDVSALRYVFDELRASSLPANASIERMRTIRDAHA